MKTSLALMAACLLMACAPKPKSAPAVAKVNGPEVIQADDGRAADPDEVLAQLEPDGWAFYFDLDGVALREPARAAALAQVLKNSGKRVLLTGNASTEGTDEYNLALGARRAANVRAYLLAAGVKPGQVTTKSLGEEAPVSLDPNQEHLNRRVDAILEASP